MTLGLFFLAFAAICIFAAIMPSTALGPLCVILFLCFLILAVWEAAHT